MLPRLLYARPAPSVVYIRVYTSVYTYIRIRTRVRHDYCPLNYLVHAARSLARSRQRWREHDPSHAAPLEPPSLFFLLLLLLLPPYVCNGCAHKCTRALAAPSQATAAATIRMCAPHRSSIYLSLYIPLRLDSPSLLCSRRQEHVNNPLPPWPRGTSIIYIYIYVSTGDISRTL